MGDLTPFLAEMVCIFFFRPKMVLSTKSLPVHHVIKDGVRILGARICMKKKVGQIEPKTVFDETERQFA